MGKLQEIKAAVEQHWADYSHDLDISGTPIDFVVRTQKTNQKLYDTVDEIDKIWQNQK